MDKIYETIYKNYIEPYIFIFDNKKCILKEYIDNKKRPKDEVLVLSNIARKKNIRIINTNVDIYNKVTELYENNLKKVLRKDASGLYYLLSSDLDSYKLNAAEIGTLKKILLEKKITIYEQKKAKDRSKKTADFEYGSITEAKLNAIEENKYIDVKYNKKGEIEYVDYSRFDDFLENDFIPKNIHIKVKLADKYGPEYLSIQNNKLVKLQLSELEYKHALEYFKTKDIIICGTSEYPDEEFENYDYFYRIKNIQTPDALDKEETINLFHQMRNCVDQNEYAEIRNKIIVGNMRLAKYVLSKISSYYNLDNSWETFAYEGLITAVDKFDVDKGYYFSTYAAMVIRTTITKYLAKYYNIPEHLFHNFFRAVKVVESDFDRKYSKDDVEMTEKVFDLLYNLGFISSLKKKQYYMKLLGAVSFSFDDNNEREEIVSDGEYNEVELEEFRNIIAEVLYTLTEREEDILRYRFGLMDSKIMYTYKEIAQIYHLSDERIRQIEAKALRKLRHPIRSQKMEYALKEDFFDTETIDYYKNEIEEDWDFAIESDEMEFSNYRDQNDELSELYNQVHPLVESKRSKKI